MNRNCKNRKIFNPGKIGRTILLSVAAFVFIAMAGCHKTPAADALAIVDGNIVSADKFRERYSKLLRMTSMRDNLQARQKLLAGLVTEEVLLAYANEHGLTDDDASEKNKEAATRQALLNAYAQHVAKSRVQVTDQDIRAAYVKLKTRIKARHLYAESLGEANVFYQRLRKGESFEVLAEEVFNDPALRTNGGDLGYFTLGDMDPAFEEAAYSLRVGDISHPVKTAYGFSVIQVTDRIRNPFSTEYEYQRKKGKIRAYLEWQETKREIKEYTRELAGTLNIKIRKPAFAYLRNLMFAKDNTLPESGREFPHVLDDDRAQSEILVTSNDRNWTVGDFWEKAEWTSLRQKERIKGKKRLEEFIKGLALREHLLAQANQLGLHKDETIQAEIEREMRSYTLKRVRDRIDQEVRATVEVPVDEIREQYEKFSSQYYFPEERNVAEILLESETLANEMVDRIRQGEAFADLARKYSLREWAKDRGGELGFSPRGKYGALADTVFTTPVGNVIGPIKIDQYYSVIKVLGKKNRMPKTFEDAREQIAQKLFWKWHKQGVHEYLERLRCKVKIESDEKKLRDLVVSMKTS